MTQEPLHPAIDLSEAQASLAAFARGPVRETGEEIASTFERAGLRIARALSRAADGGEGAFKQLAKTVLEQFARLALDQVLPQPARGARRPATAPEGLPAAAGAMIVNFHLAAGADAESIRRNQAQIAAQVARAAAYGKRNL